MEKSAPPPAGKEQVPDGDEQVPDGEEGTETARDNPESGDQTIYRIDSIEIDAEGATKPFAVKKLGRLRTGKLIYGKDKLDAYIFQKNRILSNQRVFEEAKLEYTLGEADENGEIPVHLHITLKESWNIVAVPSPKYDSNEGFSLTLSGKDFNFLGTVNPLEIDIGYERDSDANNAFIFGVDTLFPFQWLGLTWTFDFENDFKFSQAEPVFYDNSIGLLVDLPYKDTTLTFGAYESISVNEENEDEDKATDGEYYENVWYLNTELLARWNIPTGLDVYSFGELEYTPEIDFSVNYRPGADIGDSRRGIELTLKQFLGFGDAYWIGNFRQGLIAAIESSDTYNFFSGQWDNELFVSGIYHEIFNTRFGFSGRLRWGQWFNEYYDNAGDVIRGIPDEDICADYMLSANIEIPIRFFTFMPSEWFNNPKWRFFNFVEHISPFVDLAMVQDPVNGRSFNFEDMIVTGGLELTTYPVFFRTAYFRVSLGVDLVELFKTGKWPGKDHRELYIGLGHYF